MRTYRVGTAFAVMMALGLGVAQYVVSGFSRTVTVRLKADTTYD